MDWTLGIPIPVALAAVAVLGYLMGRRARHGASADPTQSRREMKRARAVVRELETIAQEVRKSLATHHASILSFKDRVGELSVKKEDAAWKELCAEAEKMLKPTMLLATQIAHAYDEIRQQTNQLMTFTEVRTDPLTGLSNRRALDDSLQTMFAMMTRYGSRFSLVIFDIDHFKNINDEMGHLHGDKVLQQVAKVFDECARETDLVARYGGEEFVVIMPETLLSGGCIFAERLRHRVSKKLNVTISGGVAQALDGDSPRTLLARADSALYSAKAGGRNLVYRHTGNFIERIADTGEANESVEAAAEQGSNRLDHESGKRIGALEVVKSPGQEAGEPVANSF